MGKANFPFRALPDTALEFREFPEEAVPAPRWMVVTRAEPDMLHAELEQARWTFVGGNFFRSGDALLTIEAVAALDRVIERLKELPSVPLIVRGHTDSLPISTRRFPDNYVLSRARAKSVKQWLVAGVDARWQVNESVILVSEVSHADGQEGDWAWKVGARGRLVGQLGYDVYLRDVGRRFDNPSSPTARPGVRNLRGQTTWSPARDVQFKNCRLSSEKNSGPKGFVPSFGSAVFATGPGKFKIAFRVYCDRRHDPPPGGG